MLRTDVNAGSPHHRRPQARIPGLSWLVGTDGGSICPFVPLWLLHQTHTTIRIRYQPEPDQRAVREHTANRIFVVVYPIGLHDFPYLVRSLLARQWEAPRLVYHSPSSSWTFLPIRLYLSSRSDPETASSESESLSSLLNLFRPPCFELVD